SGVELPARSADGLFGTDSRERQGVRRQTALGDLHGDLRGIVEREGDFNPLLPLVDELRDQDRRLDPRDLSEVDGAGPCESRRTQEDRENEPGQSRPRQCLQCAVPSPGGGAPGDSPLAAGAAPDAVSGAGGFRFRADWTRLSASVLSTW